MDTSWFWANYAVIWILLIVHAVRMRVWRFDYWLGHSETGPVVMWVKKITHIPFTRWQVHLHKMIDADRPGCFHTHPAYAIRIVLWGGYIEQEIPANFRDSEIFAPYRVWRPGSVGLIRPAYCHRVSGLLNRKVSWSLWLRGPCEHTVELRGFGWKQCSKCFRDTLGMPPYWSTVCERCRGISQ